MLLLQVLARATSGGDVNAAAQAVGPMLQILNANSGGGGDAEANAAIRASLLSSSLSIVGGGGGSGGSGGAPAPVNVASLLQSVALISSIIDAPPSEGPISPASAAAGSSFAASAAQAALASSTTPFAPTLASGLLGIAGSCLPPPDESAAASSANTTSGSGVISPTTPPDPELVQRQSKLGASVTATTSSVARGMLIGSLPGQAAAVVRTAVLELSASRQAVAPTGGSADSAAAPQTPITAGGANITVPPSMFAEVEARTGVAAPAEFDASLIVFARNMYAFADARGAPPSTTSPVVQFTVYASGGGERAIANLTHPVRIAIPRGPGEQFAPAAANASVDADADVQTIECRYWDVQAVAWSTAGCRLAELTAAAAVCECTHLTAFNIRLALSPPLPQITTQDVRNLFDWENLKRHPVPLFLLGGGLLTWVVLACVLRFTDSRGSCCCCPSRFAASASLLRRETVEDEEAANQALAAMSAREPCITGLCDRTRYNFYLSTDSLRKLFREAIVRLPFDGDVSSSSITDEIDGPSRFYCCYCLCCCACPSWALGA